MTNITIREMKKEDHPQIYEIWRNSKGIGLGQLDLKEEVGNFLKQNSKYSFVAVKDDKLLGAVLCGYDGRRAFIYQMAIDSDCRNKGIGTMLVDKCVKQLKQDRILKCDLYCFTDNEIGRSFWKKMGWKQRPEINIFSQDL